MSRKSSRAPKPIAKATEETQKVEFVETEQKITEQPKHERQEKEKKRRRKETVDLGENTKVVDIPLEPEPMVIDPVRRLIGKELIDTERTYVTQLELLVNGFKNPLEQSSKLPPKEIKLIFSNVEDILDLQVDLFAKISKRIGDNPNDFMIGDIFVDLSVYLSIYITYCCNYTASNKFLVELKQGNTFTFFKDQHAVVGCDISDLLILPVQRIPRYRLLLSSLLEHTHELHPDYNIIKEAIKKTEDVAERINRSIKELLARQQAIDFSIKLRGKLTITEDFLQPHRIFISSHSLTLVDCVGVNIEKKEHKPAERKVDIYLFNDMIVITAPKGSELEWINHAYLHISMLKKSFGEGSSPFLFHYVNPEVCFTFRSETVEQRDSFTNAVKLALNNLLITRPSLANERRLVNLSQNIELGIWDAIKTAPRFAERISVQQLQQETEIETKKALDELMDLYSTIESPRATHIAEKTPVSAAKRASSKFKQMSTLSPRKAKQPNKNKKATQLFTSDKIEQCHIELTNTPTSPKDKRKSKSVFGVENDSNVIRNGNSNNNNNNNNNNSPSKYESPTKRMREEEIFSPTPKKTKMFISPQSSPSRTHSPTVDKVKLFNLKF